LASFLPIGRIWDDPFFTYMNNTSKRN
jgi:hypothetical protein